VLRGILAIFVPKRKEELPSSDPTAGADVVAMVVWVSCVYLCEDLGDPCESATILDWPDTVAAESDS